MTEKEQTPSNHQVQQSKKSETVFPKTKPPVQKDHQEVEPKKNKSFKENKEKLQIETQKYMYDQSSKFSSVSRHLVFGIIGTIWVITYTDEGMYVPNCFLLWSLLAGLLYLFSDVFHYYLDSISYEREQQRIDKYRTQKQLDEDHEHKMDCINRRSHIFIHIKFIILIVCAICFIIGLCI